MRFVIINFIAQCASVRLQKAGNTVHSAAQCTVQIAGLQR